VAALAQVSKNKRAKASTVPHLCDPRTVAKNRAARPQPEGPFSYQSESSSVLPETTCHAAEQAHVPRPTEPPRGDHRPVRCWGRQLTSAQHGGAARTRRSVYGHTPAVLLLLCSPFFKGETRQAR